MAESNPVCQFTITGDSTEYPYFEAGPTLSVTLAGTGTGTVTSSPAGIDCGATCAASFVAGSTVQLTAVPAAGSTFDGWSGGGCGGTGTCSVLMNQAASVTATYSLEVVAPPPAAGGLASLTPSRIMDTRSSLGASGPVAAGSTVSLQVLGAGGVPASGVSAVVLNVTATQPTAPGHLTVYPDGVARPTTSSLNFSAGETIPNLVVAPVGADGKVDFYNGSSGTVQVVADVSGWFASGSPAAGGLASLTPARIMDTRSSLGASGPLAAGSSVSLQVLGAGGVPASGVSAVVLNVTATQPTAPGHLTVYPDGVARPTTSSLNFSAGETIPNLVVAPVGADGKVDFYNGSSGTVQVIADVSGWFASGSPAAGGLASLTPARIMDTRSSLWCVGSGWLRARRSLSRCSVPVGCPPPGSVPSCST